MNRTARDSLSDAIVAALRGEITTLEFSHRIHAVDCDGEPGLGDFVLDRVIVRHCMTVGDHALSTDRPGRESLLRVLAFLQSELPLIRQPAAPRSGMLRLSILAVALGFARDAGWVPFAGLWAVFVCEWICCRKPARFTPFQTRKDWRKHEPLIERFHLPQWSGDPEPTRSFGRLAGEFAATVAIVSVTALLLPLFLLCSASQGEHETEWVAEAGPTRIG